jgi:hypothetical protein
MKELNLYMNILLFRSNGNPVICWATSKRENLQEEWDQQCTTYYANDI